MRTVRSAIAISVGISAVCHAFTSTSFVSRPVSVVSRSSAPSSPFLQARRNADNTDDGDDIPLFVDRTPSAKQTSRSNNEADTNIVSQIGKAVATALLAVTLSFNTLSAPLSMVEPAYATSIDDSKKIVSCLVTKCQVPFVKCITNPKCMANVICINTCNGKADETGCQIKCGDIFENPVVGEFNKCAVSDMSCVPKKMDDGSYPVPPKEKLVQKFDTSLFNGRWYISSGQNELFDIFPCQVHFFTETAPGKFFGKLNWRIQEPDGEFLNRDAIQQFVQDPNNPAHLINHDNEYLHYEDDWYIVDYATDDNKEGVPPFAFVYYRGNNDAWEGYGGVVVYTRDAKLPESLRPRLRAAAEKVNFDYDKDFTETDNTCGTMEKGEALLLREKFAGKVLIQTEEQLQAQATMGARMAKNSVKAQKLFFNNELDQVERALEELEKNAVQFEKEIVKDIVEEAKVVEQGIVDEVVSVEKAVVNEVVSVEKAVVGEVEEVEKEVVGIFKK